MHQHPVGGKQQQKQHSRGDRTQEEISQLMED
jgi:hypothetical protein